MAERVIGHEANLLAIPSLILSAHVFGSLQADDRKSLRSSCKFVRVIVNEEVQVVQISACHIKSTGRQHLALQRVTSEFPQVEALTLLDTPRNRITGPLLADFLATPNDTDTRPGAAIRELDVKQCHFLTAPDLQGLLAACPRLQKLATSRWADGAHLRSLQPCGAFLTELELGDSSINITSITDKSLAHLPSLPALQSLSLRRCISVTDEGIAHLAGSRLPNLTHLDLSFTRVAGVSGFAGLRLGSLVLRNCRAFGDSGLASMCSTQAATLRSLCLYDTAVQPSGGSLWHLAQASALERLDLGAAWEVDSEGLAALACCSALSDLRLGNFNLRPLPANIAQNLQDLAGGPAAAAAEAAVAAVWAAESPAAGTGAGPLPALTHLSLGGMFCQHGLEKLLPRLRQLRSLELTGLDTARDEVLRMVGGGAAAALEDLRLIRGGPDLTPAGLLNLAQLPALRRLTLVGCPCATEAVVQQLVDALKSNDNSSSSSIQGRGEKRVPRSQRRLRVMIVGAKAEFGAMSGIGAGSWFGAGAGSGAGAKWGKGSWSAPAGHVVMVEARV